MLDLKEMQYDGEGWDRIVDLRLRVYVEEQGVPVEEELDALDRRAIHWAALEDGALVGTARLVLDQETAKFGRLAVEVPFRRRGIASRLLDAAVARAKAAGARRVILDAQTRVTRLYEKHGFLAEGAIFLDAGIDHIRMVRTL